MPCEGFHNIKKEVCRYLPGFIGLRITWSQTGTVIVVRRPEISLDEGFASIPHSEHPEVTLLQLEEQDHLLRIIRDLPPERQQLIILKFVEHMSNAEIGQIMGRTEGAVKSLYHRTLLSLRVDMETVSKE